MSQYKDNGKLNVVVVGGGYGAIVARNISASLDMSAFNLILINPRPYRIHLVATARMLVSDQDKLEEQAFISYDKVFHNGNGTFVQASVTSVEKEKTGGFVILDNGEKVLFYVLVVATGSKWSGPLDFPNDAEKITAWLAEYRRKFKEAKNIIIAGGGSLAIGGVSRMLMSTVFDRVIQSFQEKLKISGLCVCVLHQDTVDPSPREDAYPDSFRNRVEQSVTARGVKVLLYDSVRGDIPPGAKVVTTRNGMTLPTDLVIPAWGNKPNTGLLSALGADVLSRNGYVKIRDTFQLEAYSDIFALGDIIDVDEQKQAGKADAHAAMVSANVLSYVRGQPLNKKYKGSYEMIIITNGKYDGISYLGVLWGLVFGGWFSSLFKAKELLVSATRGAMGV